MGGDRRRAPRPPRPEAGVELHVAGLVDLLGREEGRLLLGAGAPTRPENLVVMRSSATISDDRTK